jgi:hypothetical protein
MTLSSFSQRLTSVMRFPLVQVNVGGEAPFACKSRWYWHGWLIMLTRSPIKSLTAQKWVTSLLK